MRKALQYIKVVVLVAPVVIYYHLVYMLRFSHHPEKYPLEKRYKVARKEIRYVLNRFHVNYNLCNFEMLSSMREKSLIISNHLSFMDPLLLIANSEKPVTFIAKKETFKMPFVKRVAKAIEVFPLDRENLMSQLSEIKKVVTYLKDPNKPSVIVYIEGTRNKTPEKGCLDFHAGTLKIAQMAGCPLLVMATYGSFRILDKHSYVKPYPTSISFMEKIEYQDIKSAVTTDLAVSLKEKVDTEIDSLRVYDKSCVDKSKLSKKRKELENRVNIRINS